MRKWSICMCLALALLTARAVYAALNWEGEFFQYTYVVGSNGGGFLNQGDFQEINNFADCSETSCNYSFALETTASPSWGFIEMKAGAMGPEASTSPPDGLLVKGYAEMNLNGFDPAIHGVRLIAPADGIDVSSTVSRRFSVDAEEEYVLDASMGGVIDFNVFSGVASYFSSYVVSGEVELEKLVVNEFGTAISLGVVTTLYLNDESRTVRERVLLVPEINGDDITYQFKVRLHLEAELQNFELPDKMKFGPPDFVGPFKLGSSASPIELRGFFRKSEAMPWVPLLLLDDQT